jgi:low affinity Fe/Cu permease
MMTLQHPADRGGEGRGLFEQLAERVSNVASSPTFFALCSVIVLLWALSYVFGWSQNARFFLGDLLGAITLVLVALLKNAERRAEHAVQFKLDAIARALLASHRGGDDRAIEDLEQAIGRHEDV